MIDVVVLIGTHNSGKTRTIKAFFGLNPTKRLKKKQIMDIKIDNMIFCAVGTSSEQEIAEFCDYQDVIDNIDKKIEIAKKHVRDKYKRDDFVMIIPFSRESDGKKPKKMNDDCINFPLEHLEGRFRVIIITIKRPHAYYSIPLEGDRKGRAYGIISSKNYKKNADEMKRFILGRFKRK